MTTPELAPAEVRRIDVAVTPDTVAALRLVMDRERVSLTEAARRLLGYGAFVYRAMRVDGAEMELHGRDGTVREVVLLDDN